MLPVSIMPILWLVVAGAIVGAGFWLVDEIGDRREAKVWNKINAAIAKTNAHVAKHNELDDQIAAIAEDARQKALAEARAVESACPATKDQAQALSRIR